MSPTFDMAVLGLAWQNALLRALQVATLPSHPSTPRGPSLIGIDYYGYRGELL
jgi:hypothetical protein